jgi:hypothetical protein
MILPYGPDGIFGKDRYENCASELIETQRDFLSRNEELELPHLRPIRRKSPLNLRVAAEINRTALASDKRKTPVDLIGGERQGHVDPKIRATVLDAEIGFPMDAQPETIKGDDYLLEYDSDGYPALPACLDRRKPRLREAA